ncbi:hypothetical protein [Mucilaginibacter sp. dw_454]|uniref:hypothetical protein n=1 Tax=Mucilaginibacter sp. dw_454 TaxID=2720079 RepID=UPI001BD58835|nr:hypothetical protein [Mucilaginibacter sp. dw_454]
MKQHYTLAIIAAFVFGLSACQKSGPGSRLDGGLTVSKNNLLGKWKEVKLHTVQTVNGVVTDETLTSTPTTTAPYLNAYDSIEFTQDNKATIYAAASIDPRSGVAIPYWIAASNYTYILSGSDLILTSENTQTGALVMTITKLDSNNLTLHYTQKSGDIDIVIDNYYTRN